MQKYDIIIENGTILTMDDDNSIIPDGCVCIREDTISYVGENRKKSFQAQDSIDAQGGVILPGLVNGHTHAAMSLFRGLADDRPLMEWLNNYIFPVETRMDEAFVYSGTLLACAEMIMNGTTTFCDMYLFEDAAARAAQHAGMRCLLGEVLYDFPSPNYGPIEKGFEYTKDLIEKWREDPLVSIAVEPHSPFTCSPELVTRANEIAHTYDVPLIIHVAETLQELDEIKERYNKKPIEHLRLLGLLGPKLIADHCVHLDKDDIQVLSEYDVKVIHNPESNMKLASGVAPIPEMLAQGVTVGLGTDGCASNNNLDIFSEMDIAAKLHKVQCMDPTVLDAVTVLRMATIEGSRALGLGHLTGSLEAGKKADIIVMDTHKPHLTPMYNPFSHMVYAAGGRDIEHVIINGKLVMKNRELLTIDLEEILTRAKEKSDQVRSWVNS